MNLNCGKSTVLKYKANTVCEDGMGKMKIKVDIAPGELIDKMTILEIKIKNIAEKNKLRNIKNEYRVLRQTYQQCIPPTEGLPRLVSELKAINEKLWVIEDDIRDCEYHKDFSQKFIKLARSVYKNNDTRAKLKREINILLNSNIIEEKSYRKYE
jgi:hypothetical protein